MFPGPEHLASLYPGAKVVGKRKPQFPAQVPPVGTSHHPLPVPQFPHLQGALRRVSWRLDWAPGSTGAVVGSGLGTQEHHQGQG